ncbi:MAG: CoA transferase subunit A [Anaerolineae bacterium]|nr:CoA transferase subunit A [Anaerolineae bacterium]
MPLPELLSLSDAAQLVKSGDTLGLGGLMMYRRPVAFVKALLQRPNRPTDLTLLCFTAGFESDLLVGAGMVKRVRSCYFGLETFGLAPMFTEAANAGQISICEETEASLALGLRATMGGVGFMPGFAWLGTDLLRLRPDVKTIQDPYTGETLVAFPALHCDVAVIHAVKADRYGNAILNNNLGVDLELSMIAGTVIVTAEEVVEKITEEVHIPGVRVTAVVHAPGGAAPTSCYPLYPIGGFEVLRYIDACNRHDFVGYLDSFLVSGVI